MLVSFESKHPKYLHKSMFTRIFALDHALLFWKALYSLADLVGLLAKGSKKGVRGEFLSP